MVDVADKYAIPTVEVTDGQRLDLLGTYRALPQVARTIGCVASPVLGG